MEVWQNLAPTYPDYNISSYGQVQNVSSGRVLAQSKNNTGFMKVAINDWQGVRRTVEVTRLVAETFVAGQDTINDTPIHVDGNREHTFAANLMWRPRWFAVQYHRQFHDKRHHIRVPLYEETLGLYFENSLEAAKAFGLLEQHIMLSTANHTLVYPGEFRFRIHK